MVICKCSDCGMNQEEGWPTHYKRVISAKNPKPFICRDCKRINAAMAPKLDSKYLYKNKVMSNSLLQRKYKMSYEEAKEVRTKLFASVDC